MRKNNKMAAKDPTRTRILREEFARALKKLPDSARKRILELIEGGIDEETISQIKAIITAEMGEARAKPIIEKFTSQAFIRGSNKALKDLKKVGFEIVVPEGITVLDMETYEALVNMSLDLVKGLTEETKKKMAFEIRQSLLKGEGTREIAARIRSVANMAKSRADMIARTETIRAFNTAAEKRYKLAGVKKYQFIAAKEERTCMRCLSHDGKIYRFDDAGAPKPPLHPRCRCTIVPVITGKEPEVVKSIKRETREIAFDKASEIISKIEPGTFVPDEENISKLENLLKNDKRLKELLGKEINKISRKVAEKTIKTFKKEFTHHAIMQVERAKKEGYSLIDVLAVKQRGKTIKELKNELHKIGKSRGVYLYVVNSKRDNRVITHWKITEKKYRKLIKNGIQN